MSVPKHKATPRYSSTPPLNLDEDISREVIDQHLEGVTKHILARPTSWFGFKEYAKSMPVWFVDKGWLSKTFYKGDTFALSGIRRTRRGGIVIVFSETQGDRRPTMEAFKAIECPFNEAMKVFDGLDEYMLEHFSFNDKDSLLKAMTAGIVSAHGTRIEIDPEKMAPPKKLTPADIYPNWGSW